MPDSNTLPSPQLYFQTINAYQETSALIAAIDLGLFGAIGGHPSTAAEVAERCQCPERGIRILCDYLVILSFITKEDERYALTPDTALFLVNGSPAYLGDSAKFFSAPGIAGAFDNLATTIRKGRVHTSEEGTTAVEHPVWMEFARSLGPLMILPAQLSAALVSLDPSRVTRVLDIAASHGAYGIAIAQKNPRAQIVALDWQNVLTVTEENFRKAGLADRLSKIVGDALTIDLGRDYDLVLVPNFLHHFNIADCTHFLKRVHAAMRPGGQVVIVEFVPNEDRVTPAHSASFSLMMLGTTPEGDAYTFGEYQKMLGEAGFHDASLHHLLPTAQSAVIAVA
jgi:predicted O-methyltransferase YrrM